MPSKANDKPLTGEPPTSINPYDVLGIEDTASADAVKAAYRKAALKHHPDKVSADQKDAAHVKFQEIAFAYAVLSDPRRRSRYDKAGRTEESLDLDDDDFDWSSFFADQFDNVVTEAAIRKMETEFKNSAEERADLLRAYDMFKGNMNKIYEVVLLSDPLRDESRFHKIIDEAIAAKEVEAFTKYTEESARSVSRRMKKAQKEAEEAEEAMAELKERNKKKAKAEKAKASGSRKAGAGDGDLTSLASLIQQRQKVRAANSDSFFDKLVEKHAPRGKKRGAPKEDEPPEEAFAEMAARQKGNVAKRLKQDKK